MAELDERIRPLYLGGMGSRRVAAQLGENPAVIFRRVQAMGIGRTIHDTRELAPNYPLPFQVNAHVRNLNAAAIGEAASWFLRRGYMSAIPLAVAHYDLVVESDEGFVRVQVKSTTRRDRYGRWVVGIHRMEYGAAAALNANGTRRRRSYREDEIDLFFIVTGDGEKYLVPLKATGRATNLTLNDKYAAYKID
jgi:PD-(D/E)XK endonuclease